MGLVHRAVIRRALATLVVAGTACGRPGPPEALRVTSSPVATPTAVPTATPTAAPTARPSLRPSTTPTANPAATLADARVRLTQVAVHTAPVAMALQGGRIYVAEKRGRVRVLGGEPLVLDISREVSTGGEQGLLGLAFSPDGRFLYVNFTNTSGDTRVREYAFADGRVDEPTARQVLAVDQPYSNHNGGHLVFGPDGRLWIGLGDGGAGGDPHGNGQNLGTLLGKMLRIDPRPSGADDYGIPPDNPFVGRAGARAEIWAYGLRNPWRYEFDTANRDLWIGDVGQGEWEEVDHRPGSSRGGENYGWSRMEGKHSFDGGSAPAGHVGPVFEYSHAEGCSITGGFVYRGAAIPALQGAYLFGDYCDGRVRALRDGAHRFLGPKVGSLSSFGQDLSGELYALSLDGPVYRIDPA